MDSRFDNWFQENRNLHTDVCTQAYYYLYTFFFLSRYNRISTYDVHLIIIALIIKLPISLWCKWDLNPRYLIRWQKTLPIKLIEIPTLDK